jgi:probable HAF family extracellular repeat protein
MTVLPPISGDVDGAATAINDRGQAVGISGICDQAIGEYTAKHAVLWDNGVPFDLGNFDGGIAWNTPTAINNRTEVVGFANQPHTTGGAFNPVAFVWTREHRMQMLPPLDQDTNSWAWGINVRGQVVGQSFGGPVPRAFIYQNGLMTDLNDLVQPSSPLHLVLANDINDRGEIVGSATDASGATVAFLAVPVDGDAGDDEASVHLENSARGVAPARSAPLMPMFGRFAPGSKQ